MRYTIREKLPHQRDAVDIGSYHRTLLQAEKILHKMRRLHPSREFVIYDNDAKIYIP